MPQPEPAPGLGRALAMLAHDPLLGGIAIRTRDPEVIASAAATLAQFCAAPLERLPLSADSAALPGILSRASNGVLLVPYPDLLGPQIAAPLHTALKHSKVRLVLGIDPDIPQRWPGLLDLCGLILAADALAEIESAATSEPTLDDEQLQGLIAAALALGVPGWRADTIASRAAVAHAALEGRAVEKPDLNAAVQLVLAPRATRLPDPPTPPPDQPNPGEQGEGESGGDRGGEQGTLEEKLIAAAQAYLPDHLLGWPQATARRNTLAAGRARGGARVQRQELVRAATGQPGAAFAGRRRPDGASLDPAATLTAALPLQTLRRRLSERSDTAPRLLIRTDDLRWRRKQAPPGVLFLIAVDGSGSMARNRLAQAKGAALALLERAYQHRDQVALLSFRGSRAQLLLPPTRSTARAARLIAALPAGGGTPLAAALDLALTTRRQAIAHGASRTMLVLLTDGRANSSLNGGDPQAEVAALAVTWSELISRGEAAALVVDTRARFVGGGEAATLAAQMGARYILLPNDGGRGIGGAAQGIVAASGWRG